jgi:hypothetical protein
LWRVVFRVVVLSAACIGWVEVHLFLCVCSMSHDSLQCHFAKEGNRPYGVDEAEPGDLLSQSLPFDARENQHLVSILLGFRREVSWSFIAFPLL